jgi:peptidoglycan/LPS O-acetylase OafA/YrhL
MRSEDRSNDFDALRFVAAAMVLIAHAVVLPDYGRMPRIAGIPLAQFGVYIFFTLSGFLIATSWRSDPRPGAFALKRALRILPGLAVVILLTVFVLGPVATRLSVPDYFSRPETAEYLSGMLLVPQYELPGVFTSHATSAVNGSLWTLGLEVLCYAAVAVIGLLLRDRGAPGLVGFGALCVALVYLPAGHWAHEFGRTGAFFAAGALVATTRLRLPRTGWLLAILPAWLIVGSLVADPLPLALLVLPLLVLGLGSRSTPVLRRSARFGDISYGLYLWNFPVQQLVVEFLPPLPFALDVLVVALTTSAIAFASWHFVERPALAFKPRSRVAVAGIKGLSAP